jgi:hypothetical protein
MPTEFADSNERGEVYDVSASGRKASPIEFHSPPQPNTIAKYYRE